MIGPTLKSFVRGLGHAALSEYNLYVVFFAPEHSRPLPPLPRGISMRAIDAQFLLSLSHHPDPEVRKIAEHGRQGLSGFALIALDRPIAIAFYADRSTYISDEIWPLEPDRAAMVEILTLADHRSRCLAPLLIEHSANAMRVMGKQKLIAWVWWSHSSSRRAFGKA